MQKDKTGSYVDLFISMGDTQDDSVDLDVASEFVCCMYVQHKTRDVNEARYNKLMQMTGNVDEVIYTLFRYDSSCCIWDMVASNTKAFLLLRVEYQQEQRVYE